MYVGQDSDKMKQVISSSSVTHTYQSSIFYIFLQWASLIGPSPIFFKKGPKRDIVISTFQVGYIGYTSKTYSRGKG
jgi:hypothetical protein